MPLKKKVIKKKDSPGDPSQDSTVPLEADPSSHTRGTASAPTPSPPGTLAKEEADAAPRATTIRHDPVILQLPIGASRIEELMEPNTITDVLEYNPQIMDPQPYTPWDKFMSMHDTIHEGAPMDGAPSETPAMPPKLTSRLPPVSPFDAVAAALPAKVEPSTPAAQKHMAISHPPVASGAMGSSLWDPVCADMGDSHAPRCYWCCHPIDHMEFGLPIRYDVFHNNFTMYGTFCSLECTAAFNYSTHMGSDRVWEIHSWIQMLAHRYGYHTPVRPAPSRYLLKWFNGPMTIQEFRQAHHGQSRTYTMNIPPFIHVASQMEVVNTSFLEKKSTLLDPSGRASFKGAKPAKA